MDPTDHNHGTPVGRHSRRTLLRALAASGVATAASGVAIADEHDDEVAEDDDPDPNGELGIPVAGDFPEGPSVGLQRVADGLPAPTDLQYVEVDGQMHHFVVTQTGQIYRFDPDALVDEVEEPDDDVDDETVDDGDEIADDDVDDDVEEFVFIGVEAAWIGQEPAEIDGEENPTLELEPGQTYRFTWVNGDGLPHNVVILDPDDNVLEATEIITESGEEQTLEFEATEEMHRYICEVHPADMNGRIRAEDPPDPPEGMELFLDLEERLVSLGIGQLGNYDERGLLSMAPHPEFEDNRKFYVRYSAPERHGLGYDHTDVLAEFEADEDLAGASLETERTIMEIPQPQDNHNGGQVAFGPDGYLYTSIGDGGNVHDIGVGHVDDWYDENEGGNGQDTSENLLGGIIRIDVDPESDAEADGPQEGAYEIPEDNPLVGYEGHLEEYYAWGFRNPWGMSIDDDGTVFVADAGQHLVESVYVVERGGNYSWNVKEGSFCFSPETPLDPPPECPDAVDEDVLEPRGGEPLRDPIAEYQHMRVSDAFIDSSVVVGGHRYVGEAIPELQGNFVFANWSAEGVANPDGEVLMAVDPGVEDVPDDDVDDELDDEVTDDHDDELDDVEDDRDDAIDDEIDDEPDDIVGVDERWGLEELQFAGAEDESINRYVYSIEHDAEGELYVLANTDYRPFPQTGEIYKIVPEGEGEEVPAPEDPETIEMEQPEEDDVEEADEVENDR